MIPYSRPKLSDLYTLSQSKLLENMMMIPFTAAHTYTAIYGSTPPPPHRIISQTFQQNLLQTDLVLHVIYR